MIRARAFATIAAVALLAAGCSTTGPSVAAVVGDQPVSERAVTRASDGCGALLPDVTAQQVRRDVVVMFVRADIARQVAPSNVDVSSAAVRAAAQRSQLSHLLTNAECSAVADAGATLDVVVNAMGQAAFVAAASQVRVEVNPRYGTWDAGKFSPSDSGSISQLAPK